VRCSAAQLSRLAAAFRTARAELTVPRVDTVSVPRSSGARTWIRPRFGAIFCCRTPVITGGLAGGWACVTDWTTGSAPNYAWLEARFGEMEVTIKRNAAGSGSGADVPEAPECADVRLKEWLHSKRALSGVADFSGWCLKDWHLAKRQPDCRFYSVPPPFEDDCLDSFSLATSEDDYRFVYWGGGDTWTPRHEGVLRSYSWSTSIVGRKLWQIWTPRAGAAMRAAGQRAGLHAGDPPPLEIQR
jgi:hypothetical protein